MSDILELDGVTKRFGGITAVDGATFGIEEETITGLIGPNGAGKTTTFNLISGFYEPDEGSIYYDGTDLQELMVPSRTEHLIWSSAAGITGGVIGGAAGLGVLSLGPLGGAGTTVAGAGVGAGVYAGQHRLARARPDHTNSRPYQLARAGLVRTFQITRELAEMTARENLMLAPLDQAGEHLVNAWFRRDAVTAEEQAVRRRADEMLETLEIDHVADEPAGNLSGGQRKLLELGRVLMLEPQVILLDEPVAGVNPTLTQKLIDRIETLRDEGYTFCIVEHDMDVIMSLSDRIIVMNEGQKLVEGPPDAIREDDRVIDAYLGVA